MDIANLKECDANTLAWIHHNDNLFHTRIGFWLTAQSVALAIVASSTPTGLAGFLICGLGFFLALLWHLTCRNVSIKHEKYSKAYLPERFREEWHGSKEPKGWRRLGTSRVLLTTILPCVFAATWLVLFLRTASVI